MEAKEKIILKCRMTWDESLKVLLRLKNGTVLRVVSTRCISGKNDDERLELTLEDANG